MVDGARAAWAVAFALVISVSDPAAAVAEPVRVIDRVVARFRTSDAGGRSISRAIFARELSFEARLESMASGASPDATPTERHIRTALTRHVTETLLEELPREPPSTPIEVGERAARARTVLIARVGGEARLQQALQIERISVDEIDAMMRRTARASLYLDRMVAPLVDPTEAELRDLHETGQTPYTDRPFTDVADVLRRWVVAKLLAETLDAFYQRTRSRLVITWVASLRR